MYVTTLKNKIKTARIRHLTAGFSLCQSDFCVLFVCLRFDPDLLFERVLFFFLEAKHFASLPYPGYYTKFRPI